MFETGHFATLWRAMAEKLGLVVDFVPGDWRSGVDPAVVEAKLRRGSRRTHTRRCSSCTTRRRRASRAASPPFARRSTAPAIRRCSWSTRSRRSRRIDYRHDEWGVDVTVAGSQKGLMLPPGISFNAVSDKALAASKQAKLPRAYWRWDETIAMNRQGYFPSTPATNLLYGLHEAIAMLREEGLPAVFARHQRHAEATRRAVRGWGLEVLCRNPAEYSGSLTAVMMPGRPRRRRVPARGARALRHVARHRPRPARAAACSASAISASSTISCCAARCAAWRWASRVRDVPHQKNGVGEALAFLQESDTQTTTTAQRRAA